MLGLHSPYVFQEAFGQLTGGGIDDIRFAGAPNVSITNPGALPLDEVPMPIAKSVMKRCMDKIFDVENSEEDPNTGRTSQPLLTIPGGAVRSSPAKLRQIKWTPPDSITRRFAMAFTNASLDYIYGPYAFAQVWYKFVKRLRTYYDSTKNLPGMSEITQPNLSHCLLHQKLEMLQCCISAKRKRHELYDNTKDFGGDEFYDAQSDQSEDLNSTNESERTDTVTESTSDDNTKSAKSIEDMEPTGRLHPFGELRLLHHPDTLLYVPITQDRSPMTEDMLDEYTRYLSSLDDGDSRIRAQLDVLCSDMQAFKAANPKCCLEDFIRWHSPKDWSEEEGTLA
ncbi:unnamed protein product [Cylicostephanus goldi]|uniref:Rab3 GTPase-activating protein catalytic subunit n=1 Tax=Cylicostephanus goldi TaxID=71465 RepID=A0A3P6RLS9_CYLGO|nr:unnamed protein product [Cylicostephanus goldi]